MAGPAQGEQGDCGCFAVFSFYPKRRKGTKRNDTRDYPGPLTQAETLLAHIAVSPPTASPGPSAAAIHNEPLGSLDSDLWSRAYQSLDGKTRKWINDVSADKGGKERAQDLVINDLIKIVKKREEEYKDAAPTLKISGFKIQWIGYADRVVIWVTAIGNIAINPSPSTIPSHLVSSQDASQAYAFSRLSEGRGKQFLRALVSGGQGAKLVSRLTEKEHKVSRSAQGCGAMVSKQHQHLLKSLAGPLRNVEDTVKRLVKQIDSKALTEAREYISKIPVGDHQQEKRDSRTPKTGEWLLNHVRFLEWEGSDFFDSVASRQGASGQDGKGYTLSFYRRTIIVLDALDECEREIREALAVIFSNLVDKGEGTVKLFIASCKEKDIEVYLGS
ncbi:hypothetical protein M440DRAFT_22984 [Trichoderma longibrachiatum ATCC 18648]|uniref:Nephrocystin 3-like N-terminal domain-containing protein n=1 Tax=Trichoderma longibrachiatum ATCC 18648 TaxID=983965 RepID=A0A2T4BRJ5_TRILO|nr:hypothetical protein M440DRAFT_22984 [Trichoderma longibrachiatum ATCC 18648]